MHRRKGCNKKTVQKDWLKDLVVRETMKLIQDDAVIDKAVQLVMDVQNQENTAIPLLDYKKQRFHVRNRCFFVYGLASFGFDHNEAVLYCDKKRAAVLRLPAGDIECFICPET